VVVFRPDICHRLCFCLGVFCLQYAVGVDVAVDVDVVDLGNCIHRRCFCLGVFCLQYAVDVAVDAAVDVGVDVVDLGNCINSLVLEDATTNLDFLDFVAVAAAREDDDDDSEVFFPKDCR